MELAHQFARDGAVSGDAVIALRQRSARGRPGKLWSSEIGGLWLSVVLQLPDRLSFDLLPIRIGIQVAEVLDRIAPPGRTSLKWPNDLLMDGLKVAGILCEANWRGEVCRWVVAGIGINVFNPIPAQLQQQATRLADHLQRAEDFSLSQLEEPVIAAITRAGAVTGPLSNEELNSWAGRDALKGKAVMEPYSGMVTGISNCGSLLVLDAEGRQHQVRSGVVMAALSGKIPP